MERRVLRLCSREHRSFRPELSRDHFIPGMIKAHVDKFAYNALVY